MYFKQKKSTWQMQSYSQMQHASFCSVHYLGMFTINIVAISYCHTHAYFAKIYDLRLVNLYDPFLLKYMILYNNTEISPADGSYSKWEIPFEPNDMLRSSANV
jgi:hypothetical protein